jgi:hypothetical protein
MHAHEIHTREKYAHERHTCERHTVRGTPMKQLKPSYKLLEGSAGASEVNHSEA